MHVDDHEPHMHVSMLTELLYPLQGGNTSLHLAARRGHTTCVEHLLTTSGIDANIKDSVSWSHHDEPPLTSSSTIIS